LQGAAYGRRLIGGWRPKLRMREDGMKKLLIYSIRNIAVEMIAIVNPRKV
jgi:hypothetical protein